ncbi:MAG: hypothetical protein ACOYMR_17010 [Ilumatobacteraceae bacterium]
MDDEQFGTVLTKRTPFPRLVREVDEHGQRAWHITHRGLYALNIAVFVLIIVWSAVVGEFGWRVGAVMLSATFLLVPPLMLMLWEDGLDDLARRLIVVKGYAVADLRADIVGTLAKVDRYRWLLVGAPILTIVAAPWFSPTLSAELHLTSWEGHVAAALVLALGGVMAGYSLWAAAATIAVTRAVSQREISEEWTLLGGPTAPTSAVLERFCGRSALYFSFGAAVLSPGLLAGAANSHGSPSVLMVFVLVWMLGVALALLVWPAAMLNARARRHRDESLAELGKAIEEITDDLIESETAIDAEQYFKLRSLLELRQHLMEQPMSVASSDLLRRIPVTALPILSTSAAWLALVRPGT